MAQGFTGGLSIPLPLIQGGTNAALTPDNGAVPYSTASAIALLAAAGSSGKALLSGGAGAPTWSTANPITQVVTQTFTSSGTYTPTAGMVFCIVEVQAGGGGGGGTNSASAEPPRQSQIMTRWPPLRETNKRPPSGVKRRDCTACSNRRAGASAAPLAWSNTCTVRSSK